MAHLSGETGTDKRAAGFILFSNQQGLLLEVLHSEFLVDEASGLLGEKHKVISLAFHPAQGLPTMILAPIKIEQVLNNFIDNAVKFSPAGSHVEIRLAAHDDAAELSVRDGGPGHCQEDRGGA